MSFETGDHAELIVQPPSIDLGPDEADKEAVNQRRDSTESKKSEVRQWSFFAKSLIDDVFVLEHTFKLTGFPLGLENLENLEKW